MDEVFDVEEKVVSEIVLPNGERVKVDGEITVDELKRVARENGIKKFIVEGEDGQRLTSADFPYSGTVYIKEYNAPKF